MTSTLPFVDLAAQRRRLGSAIDEAVARVIDHGRYIMGPEVGELETQLAARAGVAEAVSCASGTDALLLPLLAEGIGRGDAVIVPAFTYPATPEVVRLLGASVVFVDVERESFNIRSEQVSEAVECAAGAGLRARAVIGVDLFGQPCDYEELEGVSSEHGLWVLADAAQSFGASYHGRPAGSSGRCAATSFFPAKPLGCYGDGGAVLTDDPELARTFRSLRQHGAGETKYESDRVGMNSRLDTIQAAILLTKLQVFDDELRAREVVADRYLRGLESVVAVPRLAPERTSAWAQFTIQVDERDRVQESMQRAGIPTNVYYPTPLHRQRAFEDQLAVGDLANAVELCGHVLSLPMHPYLETADQDRVIEAVRDAVD